MTDSGPIPGAHRKTLETRSLWDPFQGSKEVPGPTKKVPALFWVAVKELKVSYHNMEIWIYIYIYI